MSNNIKDLIRAISSSSVALVNWIKSLKAYYPFKTIFQSKFIKNFESMDLISISKDLLHKKKIKNNNLETSKTHLKFHIFVSLQPELLGIYVLYLNYRYSLIINQNTPSS